MLKKLGSADAQIVAMGVFEPIEAELNKTTASVSVIVEEGVHYIIAIGGYENNTSTENISNFRLIEKKRVRHGSGFTTAMYSSTKYSGSGALTVFIGEAVSNSMTIAVSNSTSSRMQYCVIKI